MSDFEQLLPPRLHALADDLTPALDLAGQADAARRRHKHQRRTRLGVAAVAVVVIAVSVGIPTAFSVLSAPSGGRVADSGAPTNSAPTTADASAQARAEAQALAEQAASSAAAESAAAAASPGPYQQMESHIDPAAKATMAAEEARGAAELTDALVALQSPVRLGTPPAGAACPDAAAVLTRGIGTHVGYEQGTLSDGRGGCQWSNDVDTPMGLPPEVRLTVGAEYLDGAVESLVSDQQRLHSLAQPGQCLIARDTRVDPQAVLQRCVNGGWVEWSLFLPTTGGAGTWVLEAFIGDDLSSPPAPGAALTQVAALARSNWGSGEK